MSEHAGAELVNDFKDIKTKTAQQHANTPLNLGQLAKRRFTFQGSFTAPNAPKRDEKPPIPGQESPKPTVVPGISAILA